MNKLLIGLFTILLFDSCDSYKTEHNGYFLSEAGEIGDRLAVEREDVSFYRYVGSNNEKKILEKGLVLKYHLPNGTIDTKYSWGEGSVVESCIVKYGVDDTFFIVEQKSLDDVFGKIKFTNNKLSRDKNPDTVGESETMVNKCDCSKFWIINIKTDDIYGPFSYIDFVQKRKELGVSNKLTLRNNENLQFLR